MAKRLVRLAAGIWLCSGVPGLWGQSQRAIILGRAVDSSGGIVPGAEIRVIQKSTGFVRNAVTNEKGNYEVPGLFPGTYRIEASLAGFKTAVVDDVPLQGAQRLEINVALEVGQISDSVVVTSRRNLLDVADVGVSTVFDEKKLSDLPIGRGNATLLFLFAPAASSAGGTDASPTERQTGWLTNFNGSPRGSAEFTLDGAPNTQLGNTGLGGGPAFLPNTEVVQEVRIQTNNFDASLGHTGGVTVDLVLKSGTNEYHGSGFGFMRNSNWNANSWSSNRTGRPRPDFTYRRWGAAGGGPVRLPGLYNGKNRTFFYYGFERYAELNAAAPVNATVPTADQLRGDFSGLLKLGPQYQLYDPDTGIATADGRIQRSEFPNNIIPESRIDATARKLIKLWPAANQPGTADGQFNYSFFLSPIPRQYWASTLRMDHELTKSHKLNGKFLWADLNQPYFTQWGNPDPAKAASFTGLNRDLGLSDVWTISPSFIAEFRASVERGHFDETPQGRGESYDALGFGEVNKLIDTAAAGLPYVIANGYRYSDASGIDGPIYQYPGRLVISEVRDGGANFTKILGNHSLKFGADVRGYIYNTGYADTLYGANFTGNYTRGPFNNSAAVPFGGSLADLLLGKYNFSYIDQRPTAANYSSYTGLYLNDDWKVTPRLTLNVGLRYEREGPATERFDRNVVDFDRTVDNPIAAEAIANYAKNPLPEIPLGQFRVKGGAIFAGVNGAPRTIYDPDNNNFAPRVGLAWQLGGATVVRAGYGVFHLPNGQRFFGGEGFVPGFRTLTWSYGTLDGGLTFPGNLNRLFPTGLAPTVGAGDGLKTFLGQGLNITSAGGSRARPNAYNQSWQLEIQRAFRGVYKLQVRYVGNRTLKMPLIKNLSALPDSYLSTSPERDQTTINRMTQLVPNPFFGITGVAGTIGTSRTVAVNALLVPYPHFGSIQAQVNEGQAYYNGLQVEFTRQYARGLTFQTNYTWSKSMQGLGYLNAGDPQTERVIASADRPHIWRFLGIWELPFGPGRALASGGTLGHIAGGWQVQAILFGQSGTPIDWPNVLFRGNIKDIAVDNPTRERMFNVDAGFERASAKQLEWNLRAFPTRLASVRVSPNWDTTLSLIKNTRVRERLSVQFRAEAFNVWNQHFYTSAPTTSPTSTAFGSTTASTGPRTLQLGLKLLF